MILSLHIIIAISSLAIVTYSLIRTSRKSLNVGYISVALTLISGAYLVVLQPVQMVHACMAGVVYLSIATVILIMANLKYAHAQNHEVV